MRSQTPRTLRKRERANPLFPLSSNQADRIIAKLENLESKLEFELWLCETAKNRGDFKPIDYNLYNQIKIKLKSIKLRLNSLIKLSKRSTQYDKKKI